MKYLLFSLLTFISLQTMFSGCIKTDLNCDGCVEKDTSNNQIDTTNNKDTVLTGTDHAGPLTIAVRIGTAAGPFAAGAEVKLAYSFDSVNEEKYFISKLTDQNGYVVFNDLPVNAVTKEKSYYANAYYMEGGEEMNSINGNGSNGPLAPNLKKGIATNKTLVITYK